MDTNQLIEHSRARFSHESSRRLLKEKYQTKMIFVHNGGMFRAGPELQTVLMSCPNENAVILDLYENPVRVKVTELLSESQQRWQEQMNAWLIEFEESNSKR